MYLPGPGAAGLSTGLRGNRAVHFAGGHMRSSLDDLRQEYTVSIWFWNGLPHDVRPIAGTLFMRSKADAQEILLVGGNADLTSQGKLVLRCGGKKFVGLTPLRTKFWHHASIVRNKDRVSVYLDGNPVAEINGTGEAPAAASPVFVAGGSKPDQSFEGKIDEVAVFDRALTPKEMASHYAASKMTPPPQPKPKQVLPSKPSDAKSLNRYGDAVLASKPVSFWRLHDGAKATASGRVARDQVSGHSGRYEKGANPYRPGKKTANFSGGRMNAKVPSLGNTYSVEFWFRNELSHHARPVTGYMFSRGDDGSKLAAGDHLGIGGTFDATGRLIVFNGNERNQLLAGVTELVPHSWNHVVLVREQSRVAVYLNGDSTPEMQGNLPATYPKNCRQLFIGGRNDNFAGFLGAIDEVAFYDRALRPKEVTAHFAASGAKPVIQLRAAQKQTPRAMTIAESLKQIKIRDGFELQLVAAEPLVKDPVAIDWGPDGKLWVVEMADYPLGTDGKGKPGGRVRSLEDKNGDGRYDTSTLLADGLRFPTGILAWGNGVLVTAAPDILYLEDTDGDGKADVRKTLFTGFLEGNQQLRVNGLRWGLDNWIHCASGSHHAGHGKGNWITSHVTNKKTQVGSRDFRIRPAAGLIDPQSGPSQYGRNRDDWGNWFGVQNSHPLWHYVLADHYIRRNRHFAPPDPRQQVVTPTNPRVYPAKPPQKRFHSFNQSGRFTSACSAMIYRDELLFSRGAQQHAFTCEPFHNLVQHNVIMDDGVSFRFHRDAADTKHDFFASADRWCRPVMVRTGPDGALWVVDMYRYMIEHPQWLPKTGKDELRPFYRFGDDRGRIYRIVPKGRRPRNVPRLDKLSAVQLVAALQSPSGWQRDMAQRMLVAKQDKAAVEPLAKMSRTSEQPLARLHALCALDGLDALTADTVQAALADKHPAVRRHAVRLSEGRSVDTARLVSLVNDPNVKVRLQLACTLGYSEGPRAGRALADLAIASIGDRYITAAVMSSINRKNLPHVLVSVITPRDGHKPPEQLIKTLFSQAAAIGEDKIIAEAIGLATYSQEGRYRPWQFSALGQMLDILAKRNRQRSLKDAQLAKVNLAIKRARSLIATPDAAEPQRAAAACLLLRQAEHTQADMQLAKQLLVPQSPKSVQQAIVARAANCSEKQIAAMLLTGWRSHGPALRAEILSVVASRATWVDTLLQRLESGDVSPSEIDASMRQRLMTTKSKPIRSRLQKVLSGVTTSDRRQVLAKYRAALTLTGNAKRGEVLFAKQCANCHRNGKLGSEVGPNLASLTNKTAESLLAAIIDPSAAVESKYLSYNVITKDGKSLSGIIATETGSSITLLAAGGKRESLLRGDIEALQSSGKSLMPDGLEKQLKPQDLSDLIEFVRNLGGKR
jgi:putative membrane-bound dehydrogenase-like protein